MWGKDLQFQRDIPIHKEYAVLALVANLQNHVYSSGRDGSLRYFRVPWRTNNNDVVVQAVAADITGLIYSRFFVEYQRGRIAGQYRI